MTGKTTYILRPGYGSSQLLIEFGIPDNADLFMHELTQLLQNNGFTLINVHGEPMMLGDVSVQFSSPNGSVFVDRDTWDLIFIIGDGNQADVLRIDQILESHEEFEREEADFSQYQLKKETGD